MKKHAKVGNRKGKPAYRTPSDFQSRVYAEVKKIPRGKTLSYKQVAQNIGSPHAARAVGNALNKNHDPGVPCHRVVKSDGSIGGYNRGSEKKKEILESERN